MSYQVLARKWRPKRFAELVGQEHVVRALTHALETKRIHHAFLFSGTRGVGKTTIARIFAKSLNCETGVSAEPCGKCGACTDIDAGRYMDLLEIDAASNTGVDDVRDVIENAQYRPARGNYKVYLIDEVHMLSKNAFNALLKTLEEPPEHAKFLLATTDPQKLPVTVLSRCLQFNLKRLSDSQIAQQVERILAAEDVAFDSESVREIARGGNGSLRDALSLLDQAIAYGGGALRADEVRSMLGTLDRSRVLALLEAVVAGDAPALMAEVEAVAEFAPDFATVLDELATLLHRLQLAQFVPDLPQDDALAPALGALATRLPPDEVQLLYQLATTGRRDLGLAPNPRAGFEMTLLRMLAFRPLAAGQAAPAAAPAVPRAAAPAGGRGPSPVSATAAQSTAVVAPVATAARERAASAAVAEARPVPAVAPPATAAAARPAAATVADPIPAPAAPLALDQWRSAVEAAGLRGPLRELATHAVPLALANGRLRLGLAAAHDHFRSDGLVRQLADALGSAFGGGLSIVFEAIEPSVAPSLAVVERGEQQRRQGAAEAAIAADPLVQDLMTRFDARVVPNSTRPTTPTRQET